LKLIEKRNNGTEPSINPFGRNVSCHFCLPRANGVRPVPRGLTAYITHAHRRRRRGYRPRIPGYISVCTVTHVTIYTYTTTVVILYYIYVHPYTLYCYNYYTSQPFTLLIPAERRAEDLEKPSPSPSALLLLFTLSRNSFSGSFLYYDTRSTVNPPHAPPPQTV